MKKIFYLITFFTCLVGLAQKSSDQVATNPSVEIPYKVFENDPTGLRLYTLENGLKVYLSKNNDKPKIETLIAVKAGSNYDPKEQTGLAHYLEHMVFKGTSKIGTKDWEKEKVLLKEISDLYELHKETSDLEKKKSIYRKIDSVSNKAAEYAIANEYDKMISSIGAEGTNAFTSNEMTVYKNTIPSNEFDKWLAVEEERFSELVLRLFHTELETVYEEFNRGQDSDGRKQYTALLKGMFPTHPYGTQTTIGTAEHLKNPSMEAIHAYFNKYYVPNNMAVILAGDLDFEETITKINNTFGKYESKPVSHPELPKETPITEPIEKIVYGPSEASIYIGFRAKKITDEESIIVELIDYILANSTAGLIDLNLMHILYGSPRKGQNLDDVKSLLLSQIELIKKGNFDDWLIKAVLNDKKLSKIKKYETTKGVAFDHMYSFVYDQPWEESLKRLSKMEQISKPKITPVTVNREETSGFTTKFNNIESPLLEVQNIDYKTAIHKEVFAKNITLASIENKTNDLSSLSIKYPTGSDYDPNLGIAFS